MTPMKRLADAIDLMIEFATLGEYGLEQPEPAAPRCRQGRHRPIAAPRSAADRHGDRIAARVAGRA